MAEMSMNKVIHGAFRRDLDRFAGALSAVLPGDTARARQLHGAWANFDDQLTHHHQGEHTIAWPALKSMGMSSEVLATMDAEHAKMAGALTDSRSAMDAFALGASEADSQRALAAIQQLKTVMIPHLDHEEAEFEEFYLSKRETPEMKAMGRAFGKVSPARGGRFFAWVLDGASPDEKRTVTKEVPGPVLTVMGGIFGRSYRKNIAPVWRK